MALFGSTPAPTSRLEELKRVLQRDPTSRQFLALAEEYRKHGKVRDAIVTIERGLSIHTSSVAAYVSLGKAYQQIERWEEAIRAYQNALRYDRENLVAIRQLADVHLSRGEKLEALKKLKLYQGLKPGEKDVQEAIERLQGELEPGQARAFSTSGIRSLRTERPAPAAPAAATVPAVHEPLPAERPPLPESTAPFDVPAAPAWNQEPDVFSVEAPAVPTRVAIDAGSSPRSWRRNCRRRNPVRRRRSKPARRRHARRERRSRWWSAFCGTCVTACRAGT